MVITSFMLEDDGYTDKDKYGRRGSISCPGDHHPVGCTLHSILTMLFQLLTSASVSTASSTWNMSLRKQIRQCLSCNTWKPMSIRSESWWDHCFRIPVFLQSPKQFRRFLNTQILRRQTSNTLQQNSGVFLNPSSLSASLPIHIHWRSTQCKSS